VFCGDRSCELELRDIDKVLSAVPNSENVAKEAKHQRISVVARQRTVVSVLAA
jgi:hypothetical protein